MSKRKRAVLATVAALLGAGAVAGTLRYRRQRLPEVQVETITRRNLEALVSASGKVQPKKLVNISADTVGRVTKLSVEEGDVVRKGQFLLQIDPELLESAVDLSEAGLAAGREAVRSAKVAIETARANLDARWFASSDLEIGAAAGVNQAFTELYPLGLLRNFGFDGVTGYAKTDVTAGPVKLKLFWNHLSTDSGPQYEPIGQRSILTHVRSNVFDAEALFSREVLPRLPELG